MGCWDGLLACLRPAVGYLVLAGMISAWITMSELLQNLQVDYEKPLFITNVNHGSYVWFVLPWAGLLTHAWYSGHETSIYRRYDLTLRKILLLGLVSSLLGSFCAYTWYLSLSHTTVAANNSIYQSCAAIVYVLSVIWLKEKVTLLKTVAVLVSIGGVVLVSVSTPNTSSEAAIKTTAMGYIWLMTSVIAYAIYEVIQKQYLSHDSNVKELPSTTGAGSMPPQFVDDQIDDQTLDGADCEDPLDQDASPPSVSLPLPAITTHGRYIPDRHSLLLKMEVTLFMLGVYGIITDILAVPILALWDGVGLETFQLPSREKTSTLLLNAGLESLYNLLLMFGILITSPLFISVGTMLVMPASIVVDRLLKGTDMGPMGVCGAIVIVIGFLLLNVPQEKALHCVIAARRRHRANGEISTVEVLLASPRKHSNGNGSALESAVVSPSASAMM